MTAEIAILNKSAVALAADSAVTITTPTGPKIYDSVNKLFVLVKRQPVGVMVYDSADLLGVPWETIIKAYRMERAGKGLKHLDDYGSDFMEFVRDHPALIPQALRDQYFDELVERRVLCVRARVDRAVKDELRSKKVGVGRLRALLSAALETEEALWSGQPDASWASTIDAVGLVRAAHNRIDAAIDRMFPSFPLTVAHRKRLHALIRDSLGRVVAKHPLLRGPADPRSGIVIAGFGSDEYFPRLLSYSISGIVDGALRADSPRDDRITVQNAAIISPFAQSDMVTAFVTGLNPLYEQEMQGHWRALQGEYPDLVIDLVEKAIPGIDRTALAAVKGQLGSLMAMSTRDLGNRLSELKDEQIKPILDSVEFLPKDELAAMAESLVNLTSLKRRVSIGEAQTVGGPVDVAVISRGDGFVWIKRKHYFDQELNPSWPQTHADH